MQSEIKAISGVKQVYLVMLHLDRMAFLLANQQSKALMVWDSFIGCVQALVQVEPYIGQLNPEILMVDSLSHPGVLDLYLNDFILEVAGVESVTDIKFKELPLLGLVYVVDKSLADKYKVITA